MTAAADAWPDGGKPASLAGLKRWLSEAAWPLWLAHGLDRARGGFHESLDPGTLACDVPFRRLRVAARQTYVFAQAAHEGHAAAEEAVYLGLEFLQRHAAGADGGFAWRFDAQNRVIDATRDLYDHAFVLLAFTAASGVLPREPMHDAARAVLQYLQQNFRHPAGGYAESLPPALPRRQNPHMHLLEALLLATETFGDTAFLDAAHPLIDLLRTRFFDAGGNVLGELFDDDLTQRRQADGGVLWEPGHHCEWVWLLDWYQRFTGPDAGLAQISRLLFDRAQATAQAFGLPNECATSAGLVDGGMRLWPQTERLKAAFLEGDEAAQQGAIATLGSWLRADGLWVERRDAHGGALPGPVPASSLYHLTCAILWAEEFAS